MQTMISLASQVYQWESVRLNNGAYRIRKVTKLHDLPDLSSYSDCTSSDQFCDELNCVRQLYGVDTEGIWFGLVRDHVTHSDVICFELHNA